MGASVLNGGQAGSASGKYRVCRGILGHRQGGPSGAERKRKRWVEKAPEGYRAGSGGWRGCMECLGGAGGVWDERRWGEVSAGVGEGLVQRFLPGEMWALGSRICQCLVGVRPQSRQISGGKAGWGMCGGERRFWRKNWTIGAVLWSDRRGKRLAEFKANGSLREREIGNGTGGCRRRRRVLAMVRTGGMSCRGVGGWRGGGGLGERKRGRGAVRVQRIPGMKKSLPGG